MDETEFLQQLALHIKARYPLFFVETPDDDWIIQAVQTTFSAVADVQCITHLDPKLLEANDPKLHIYLWCGASTDDWHAYASELTVHARRFRTSATLIMMGESWNDLPESLVMPPILRAPLPSFKARESIAQLALGVMGRDPAKLSRIAFASAGMTRTQLYRALSKAAVVRRENPNFDDWENYIVSEKKALMNRNSTLEIIDDTATLDDVGGATGLKIWLRQRTAVFTNEAKMFGLESPKGVLLVGVQGCGKSLLAKAIASEWHFPLLRLDMSSIFAGNVGNPDAALSRALDVADAMAPAVIWCDEIEKSFSQDSDPTTKRLLGHILNWLQERRSQAFFVATANDVQALPPELIRKGRFDETFFVDLPDQSARAEIFAIHLRRRNRNPKSFDCEKLAADSEHFSGAEIEQVVLAALFAAFSNKHELTMDDLQDAIQDTTPLYKLREDDIKRLREWAGERTRAADQNARLLDFFK